MRVNHLTRATGLTECRLTGAEIGAARVRDRRFSLRRALPQRCRHRFKPRRVGQLSKGSE